MEDLIESDSDENPEVDEDTDNEPAEDKETPAASRTRVETHRVRPPLLRALAGILAVIIIAFLLVLLGRWIYHSTHHNSPNTSPTSQQSPTSSSNKKTSGNQPAGNGTPASPSGNSQITNTGPGNVAAVFVGASLVAAGLHFIWTVRRRQT